MRQLLVMIGLGALSATALAEPVVAFFDDFESGHANKAWSDNTIVETEGPSIFTYFAGRYADERIRLRRPAIDPNGPRDTTEPPPGDDGGGTGGGDGGGNGGGNGGGGPFVQYFLSFDFYAIDSWDGDDTRYGPDRFEVRVNGESRFNESFANQHEYQSFARPTVGPVHLGYNTTAKDSIYRAITVPFTIDASSTDIVFDFQAIGLQSIYDESWGIDNVRMSYDIVPAPAGAGLMALGTLGLTRRRRN